MFKSRQLICALLSLALSASFVVQGEQRPLSVTDIMKFRSIDNAQLSNNGKWLAYAAQPDRGDSTYYVQAVASDTRYQVERGSSGYFSDDSKYIAISQKPALLTQEKASKKARKDLKNELTVINLVTGEKHHLLNVEDFQLHASGPWLAFSQTLKKKEEKKEERDAEAEENKSDGKQDYLALDIDSDNDKETPAKSAESAEQKPADEEAPELFNKKQINKSLTLVNLSNGEQRVIEHVDQFKFSPELAVIAYSLSNKDGKDNGLQLLELGAADAKAVVVKENASFTQLSWNEEGDTLAYLQGDFSEKAERRSHQLALLDAKKGKVKTVKLDKNVPDLTSPYIPSVSKLVWSLDDERLFFGFKSLTEEKPEMAKIESEDDLYDIERLTGERGLQVWHGEDPLIKTNEKFQYNRDKKHSYQAVYHVGKNKVVPLASKDMPYIRASANEQAVIASSDLNYRKLRTWEGFFSDFYLVDLDDGEAKLIKQKLSSYNDMKVSESGRYVAYYDQGHIWVWDSRKDRHQNISEGMQVSFADEDHDYPSKVPGYGIAGWVEDDEGFFAYDKFDIWFFSADGDDKNCLTCDMGRVEKRQFRINIEDQDHDFFDEEQTLLLTSYNDDKKNFGFYQLNLESTALTKLVEEDKKFEYLATAKDADAILYTREDFNEFPDLWVTQPDFSDARKLTDVNPQKDEFLWGDAQLVEWTSTMGEPHQGVLIKPANYVEGQSYPVLVYYYRLFSQRLYEFNAMNVNHRPNFPFYSSNGYAIFLPDVHFEIGSVGQSTNKSILPGIQKIIDMGVADKDAIGLHGHSWSGYQTLFSITETDMFAAAVSGAPVSNMTSAYSGIRLGTGLARQFQYEKGQSRIGASMFERRDLYIENSPVFFAERINTPLLMQFGDIDDAVPWQQGVEMYLAMRRLGKEVIFLQYEGEPHHLKKYPNKVDYTIKMKQYFDHYLKGAPAPEWMTKGEAYSE
ncbi:alpha/beta hydrolase family protein [Thalassotalea litorea]|uniref:alpha/beta hydrolase family protein n=1 Tax=Thalassotalea litorea TaxID=2020715 RepID=UPI003736BCFA